MEYTRNFEGADGTIRSATEREWVAVGTCRIARDRTTATVAVVLTTDGDEVRFTATWHREPPDPEAGYKIARRWLRRENGEDDGGRWSVEYGYEGRWWILFGPHGVPWGDLLANNLADSLIAATTYAARIIAHAKDAERAE